MASLRSPTCVRHLTAVSTRSSIGRRFRKLWRSAVFGTSFVGRELGARSKDPACYKDGRVQYARLARTAQFQRGLDRVIQEASKYRVALMCAEKDPIDCHRTILVGRELLRRGTDVAHILADGRLEPHEETMDRPVDPGSGWRNRTCFSRGSN